MKISFSNFKITKKMIVITAVVLSLGVVLTSAAVWSYSAFQKTQSPVNMTYDEAIKVNKPFVILFHAKWCGYCQRFLPLYKMLAKNNNDNYNFVMIDIDDPAYKSIVEDYSVNTVPMLYISDSKIDNRVLLPNSIYGDARKLKRELDRYIRVRALLRF